MNQVYPLKGETAESRIVRLSKLPKTLSKLKIGLKPEEKEELPSFTWDQESQML